MTPETKLKKAHIALMKHKDTALYSGIILMGTSKVVDNCPTAYTDGVNKRYGRKFVEELSEPELQALVLHENLHVALNHIGRFRQKFEEDPQLMNVCADYVVNDIIVSIGDTDFLKLPEGGLYDRKYHNWSVNEVYKDLKKKKDEEKKDGQSLPTGLGKTQAETGDVGVGNLKPLDEHDFGASKDMTIEEKKAVAKDIDDALREGQILAGKLGGKTPRSIDELLQPKVDWKAELREFISSSIKGNDEYTWRKFNKRLMANDIYMPSMENESIGELVVAIDTSGSIGTVELTEFATELVSICNTVTPEKIRVVWWDYDVHGEQSFNVDDYGNIAHLLKPKGGGGTRLSCVSDYIVKENIDAEAVVVFTDGYLESDVRWEVTTPTLVLSTENRHLDLPVQRVISCSE
jgi:predicted metal-dependent peptidase